MSKLAVVALCLSLVNIFAAPLPEPGIGETISEYNFNDIAKGSYSFRYKTPENIERQETGYIDNDGNLIVDGFYSYYDTDGKEQFISYHADKDGYRTTNYGKPVNMVVFFNPNVVASLLG